VQSGQRADTLASAIRIIEPAHREQAEAAAEVVTVSDDEIVEWWSAIARLEGLFCEPASAAGVAGVAQDRPVGRVVCVLTGHGLKDPDTALSKAPPVVNCENDLGAVERAVFDEA
jgi:threonine synthase